MHSPQLCRTAQVYADLSGQFVLLVPYPYTAGIRNKGLEQGHQPSRVASGGVGVYLNSAVGDKETGLAMIGLLRGTHFRLVRRARSVVGPRWTAEVDCRRSPAQWKRVCCAVASVLLVLSAVWGTRT